MRYLIVLMLLLSSCAKEPTKDGDADKGVFSVKLLFTYKDCEVLRFYDAGKYRYFTSGENCAILGSRGGE